MMGSVRALMPDYLRLFALFGIVVVNVQYIAFSALHGFADPDWETVLDMITLWLLNGLAHCSRPKRVRGERARRVHMTCGIGALPSQHRIRRMEQSYFCVLTDIKCGRHVCGICAWGGGAKLPHPSSCEGRLSAGAELAVSSFPGRPDQRSGP